MKFTDILTYYISDNDHRLSQAVECYNEGQQGYRPKKSIADVAKKFGVDSRPCFKGSKGKESRC